MKVHGSLRLALLGTAAVLAFTTVGCATKKHVRGVVAPVETRVSETEKKLADNSSAIGELEAGLSRADERAMEADKKAAAAGTAAGEANEAAKQAAQQAENARATAEKGIAKVGELESTFENTLQNLDTYKLVAEESVLFRFGRSTLSDEAKQKLEQAVQGLQGMRAYVIEVQGFTDRIGDKNFNLELSRRRANEVVRYLTVEHDIPLRRIHVIGLGSEKPVEEGRTRAANQANRRVEIKVYAPEYAVASGSPQASRESQPKDQ